MSACTETRTCSSVDRDGSHPGPAHVPSSDKHTYAKLGVCAEGNEGVCGEEAVNGILCRAPCSRLSQALKGSFNLAAVVEVWVEADGASARGDEEHFRRRGGVLRRQPNVKLEAAIFVRAPRGPYHQGLK
jgi:hypothetical protein